MFSRLPVYTKSYSLIALPLLFWGMIATAAECDVAQAVSVQGRVEVLPSNTKAWKSVHQGDHFCPGDRLRLGANSRAGLTLHNETLLRLDEHTSVTINAPAEDGTSWLDLLKGAAHFISRITHSFQVRTPYVNASIEGTEFVVIVKEAEADITVFEGIVVASNDAGSLELTANQSGRATSNQAPVHITYANPRDAVAWALYYPPLPEQPDVADNLAQQTVTAIAQNRLEDAIDLAKQSLATDSQSAAAYMAQSYVDQALFDIPAALTDSQKAAELSPNNALAQARLAEVWLMNGETQAARQAAENAVSIDPELSLAHTVLGFSSLREVNLDTAKTAFEKAIDLDSAAPLPRLGLGLVMIRLGALAQGRREIETATLHDPNNALLRSYMGKAYYEEKRNGLASEQFAMAKALDPNDPTAWFYDSILLQSENRPVEALQAQQQAIKLNDNRGVYRSRQLLDQDGAARNTSVARIYSDLGFEKLAITEGARALSQAPDNFSAHRFMADINATQPQRGRAVDSELLQSKLLQPLTTHTLRPELSNLQLADGPARLSYNEFNPLFTQSGPSLLFNGFAADNDTWGDDVIASYLHDRFSISLAQHHFESDGFRTLDWIKKDTLKAFIQLDVTPDTMIQLEHSDDEQENGDLNQHFFADDNQPEFQEKTERKLSRFGFRHAFTSRSVVLGNYHSFKSTSHTIEDSFTTGDGGEEHKHAEVQWLRKGSQSKLIIGGSRLNRDTSGVATLSIPPLPDFTSDIDTDDNFRSIYLYSYIPLTAGLELILGSSYSDDEISRVTTDFDGTNENGADDNQFNPKLGIVWDISDRTTLRTAFFRERPLISSAARLEPTQIAGFNQVYDDFGETLINDARRAGIGLDTQAGPHISIGISALYSDLKGRIFNKFKGDIIDFDMERHLFNSYLYYTINNDWLLNLEYEFENFESPQPNVPGNNIVRLKTHKLPISLRHFFSNHFSSSITGTYYSQDGIYEGNIQGEDDFWLFDANVTYILPDRYGKITIGAKNLFDTEFNYEDKDNNSFFNPNQSSNINELSTERIVYGQFSINF